MMRRPLHIVRVSDSDPSQVEVIDSNDIAYGFFDVAKELWRLAGQVDRATAIEDEVDKAYDLDPPRLERAQLVALMEQLGGLEDALVGSVTDANHMLSAEKVAALRGQTENLDLDESRGELARHAVIEALIYVDRLRAILHKAIAENASIAFR